MTLAVSPTQSSQQSRKPTGRRDLRTRQRKQSVFAVDCETTESALKHEPYETLCVSVAWRDSTGQLQKKTTSNPKRDVPKLGKWGRKPVMHNAKFDLGVLKDLGAEFEDWEDTILMSYVANPNRRGTDGRGHSLSAWGERLGHAKTEAPEFTEYTPEMGTYCENDAELTLLLYEHLNSVLTNLDWEFYLAVEKPFLLGIQEMEGNGMLIDQQKMLEYREKLIPRRDEAYEKLQSMAGGSVPGKKYRRKTRDYKKEEAGEIQFEGMEEKNGQSFCVYRKLEPLNPNANGQLAGVMQRELGWKPQTQTNSGAPSLDSDVVKRLSKQDNQLGEFSRWLLTYRDTTKQISTFIDGILEKVNQNDGRLRATFNQTVTKTGRLSSSDPNLQNLPSKNSDDAECVRGSVIAPEGRKIIAADISQFQYRIFVWFAMMVLGNEREDVQSLIEGYTQGDGDIHEQNRKLLSPYVPHLMESESGRKYAKTFGFAMLFGAKEEKIAKAANLEVEDAKKLLDAGKEAISCVDLVSSFLIENCRANGGSVRDIYGRRLYYPGIFSDDKREVSAAERQIFNAVIQSSEATIMKAMYEHIKKRVPELDMVAQVHDELVFECDDDKVEEACTKIKEVFEMNWLPGSDKLPDIPVTGDAMYGQTWMEAK